MSLATAWKSVENYFHSLVTDVKPALDFLEKNGGQLALSLAEGVLAATVAGTPWAQIVATFVPLAEAQGITLAEQAGSIVLNIAKANLDAKNLAAAPVAEVAPVAAA